MMSLDFPDILTPKFLQLLVIEVRECPVLQNRYNQSKSNPMLTPVRTAANIDRKVPKILAKPSQNHIKVSAKLSQSCQQVIPEVIFKAGLSEKNVVLRLKSSDIFKCFSLEHNVSKAKHLRSVLAMS